MAVPSAAAYSRTCTAFKYENEKHIGYNNTLWVLDESLISYSGIRGSSPWHGAYRQASGRWGGLTLQFDYDGRAECTKHVSLLRTGDDVWEGFDYAHRAIKLTRLRTFEWCPQSMMWR